MSKETKNKIELLILLIILVIVIIFAVNFFNKDKNHGAKEENNATSGVDMEDSAYEGMNVYKKNGETIIEDSNGTKTVETTKTKEKTSLVATTENDREKYQIKDVKVREANGNTIISGNVTNNDSKKHNLIINVKFYSSDNKIKGATSKKIEVKSKQTENFTMSTMDDLTQYTYKIVVEYAD